MPVSIKSYSFNLWKNKSNRLKTYLISTLKRELNGQDCAIFNIKILVLQSNYLQLQDNVEFW